MYSEHTLHSVAESSNSKHTEYKTTAILIIFLLSIKLPYYVTSATYYPLTRRTQFFLQKTYEPR
jgi:hypothetical protein